MMRSVVGAAFLAGFLAVALCAGTAFAQTPPAPDTAAPAPKPKPAPKKPKMSKADIAKSCNNQAEAKSMDDAAKAKFIANCTSHGGKVSMAKPKPKKPASPMTPPPPPKTGT